MTRNEMRMIRRQALSDMLRLHQPLKTIKSIVRQYETAEYGRELQAYKREWQS